ncbi:MAG: orotate phosphoribosyltransferase [Nitrospirae bacterium]|nr:orotate phosphoribosyltransferase [Candidatus Manganitrophaceae bacterium]
MTLENKNRRRLLDLLFKESFRYSADGSFQLTSGKKTPYYIDCKKVSLDAEGATLIGREIFEEIRMLPVEGVGGMTLGADPIATAVSVISFLEKRPIQAFIVRKTPKAHGSKRQIEGNLQEGAKVVVVEDVVTTGGSTLRTLEALGNEGYIVLKVIALVDRKEGGREAIEKTGVNFESLFTIDDFTRHIV